MLSEHPLCSETHNDDRIRVAFSLRDSENAESRHPRSKIFNVNPNKPGPLTLGKGALRMCNARVNTQNADGLVTVLNRAEVG